MTSTMHSHDSAAVRSSALWAALGDALGFVTEMTDAKGVVRRAGADRVGQPVAWKRRIGGKFGVDLELPEGCYSDDTQLRLATSRAIRADGTFDVEAFSKVELPVWRAYALGAGRGTKAAAQSLAKRAARWTNNFFVEKGSDYLQGGGNGAAMRIQPHVWSARGGRPPQAILLDVVRNAICTHGHVRAIVGAAFHAVNLAFALTHRRVPDPNDWKSFLSELRVLPRVVGDCAELAEYWLPEWERTTGQPFAAACHGAVHECYEDIRGFAGRLRERTEATYREIADAIGGTNPETRGSGTKTAILASVVAWMFAESPGRVLDVAVNALGTDTDTIATMAGAVIGAVHEAPQMQVRDSGYLAEEALRLAQVARGEAVASFRYPDLLHWNAPLAEVDVVGRAGGRLAVAGLGVVEGDDAKGTEQRNIVWQWLRLPFGQSILARRRRRPREVAADELPRAQDAPTEGKRATTQATFFDADVSARSSRSVVDAAMQKALRSDFDPAVVGRLLVDIARGPDGVERSVEFTALVARALRVQERQGRPT